MNVEDKCGQETNLGKPTCPKKSNLLVYKQKEDRCQQPAPKSYIPPISTPQMKRIKVCTAAELKRICAPPPCPCPKAIPRPGVFRRMAQVAGFGVRTLVALGAIYVTYDMGVWGDSETTGQLYKSICLKVMPGWMDPRKDRLMPAKCKAESQLYTPSAEDRYCCDKFPIDTEKRTLSMQQQWNSIVSGTFSQIASLPYKVGKLGHDAVCESDSCDKQPTKPKK